MYYPCSENKGADQLRGNREVDLRLCFRLCILLVSPYGGSYTFNISYNCISLLVFFFFFFFFFFFLKIHNCCIFKTYQSCFARKHSICLEFVNMIRAAT